MRLRTTASSLQMQSLKEDDMLACLIKGAISVWQDGMDYLRDRRKRTNLIKELDMCGPEECRGLLGQYGLTRKQFENAIRIPFASEDLASAALRAVGVDPSEFHREHSQQSRNIRHNCTVCRAKYRCWRDLMSDSFVEHHREYCPNTSDLADLLSASATCSLGLPKGVPIPVAIDHRD